MFTTTYETKDGREISIKGEWNEDVIAWDEAGNRIGALELSVRQNEYPPHNEHVWLSHAEINASWRRQGIATACICFARDKIYGHDMTICAPSRLDTMREQGNMLSIDGGGLMGHLRKLGCIAPDPADRNEDV